MTIKSNISVEEFTAMMSGTDLNSVGSLVISVMIYICRLMGIVVLIWGIYDYMTARKDGNSSDLTPAIIKVVFAIILILMGSVLGALGIVSKVA